MDYTIRLHSKPSTAWFRRSLVWLTEFEFIKPFTKDILFESEQWRNGIALVTIRMTTDRASTAQVREGRRQNSQGT